MKNVATTNGHVVRPADLRAVDDDVTELFGLRGKRLAVGNSGHAKLKALAAISILRIGAELGDVISRENSLPQLKLKQKQNSSCGRLEMGEMHGSRAVCET
jgi:hypothetical protein